MLKINSMPRGSGKTTKAVEKVLEDENSILIVHHEHLKNYLPQELLDTRVVLTLGELQDMVKNVGSRFIKKNIVIDEVFIIGEENLAKLFYSLGRIGVPVEVFGTTRVDEMTAFNKQLEEDRKLQKEKVFGVDIKVWNEVVAPCLDSNYDRRSHLNIILGEKTAREHVDILHLKYPDNFKLRDYYEDGQVYANLSNGETHLFIDESNFNSCNFRGRRFSSVNIVK